MSHRITTVPGGVQYPPGNVAAQPVSNTYYNQSSSNIKAFNGHPVEVFSDGAVWDTVAGVYLYPGRDFNLVP
jgi:hypothetical protein